MRWEIRAALAIIILLLVSGIFGAVNYQLNKMKSEAYKSGYDTRVAEEREAEREALERVNEAEKTVAGHTSTVVAEVHTPIKPITQDEIEHVETTNDCRYDSEFVRLYNQARTGTNPSVQF